MNLRQNIIMPIADSSAGSKDFTPPHGGVGELPIHGITLMLE